MNPDLVKTKLENLARCLVRIQEKTPATKERFPEDFDAQDLVMKNVERAVQVCVDVANHLAADEKSPPPGSMSTAFFSLIQAGILDSELARQMAATVGLRNLASHEYEPLDYGRIYEAVTFDLSVFERYAQAVRLYLKTKA